MNFHDLLYIIEFLESDTDGLMEYLTYGAACVLGESFNKLILNYATNRVEIIRNNTVNLIRKTKGI
jgi:hypothetical protein